MAKQPQQEVLQGETFDNGPELTVDDICGICSVSVERVERLVEEGVVEPVGGSTGAWRFSRVSVSRVLLVERLARDLDVNTPGAALALDLMDELQRLRERLRWLERLT